MSFHEIIHPHSRELVDAKQFTDSILQRDRDRHALAALETKWVFTCMVDRADEYDELKRKHTSGLLGVSDQERYTFRKYYELFIRPLQIEERCIHQLCVGDFVIVDASDQLRVNSVETHVMYVEALGMDILPRKTAIRFMCTTFRLTDKTKAVRGSITITERGVFVESTVDELVIRRVFQPQHGGRHVFKGGILSSIMGKPHLLFDPQILSLDSDVVPLLSSVT